MLFGVRQLASAFQAGQMPTDKSTSAGAPHCRWHNWILHAGKCIMVIRLFFLTGAPSSSTGPPSWRN